MTTRFFPGFHDPDADRLNTLLDAMRSGMRAPDPASTSEEATQLAVTASQFRTLDAGARVAAGATDTTFDSIWEDMMSAYAVTNPTTLANDSPGREERIHQRVIPVPPRPTFGWWNGLLSAAIVTLMIAGLIAAAWTLRETGGNGTGDDIRLAATALDGTPAPATPEGDADWMSWLTPEECTTDPMSQEEYTAILSKVPDTANRSYTLAGPAPPESAEGAVQAARSYEACSDYGLEDQRRGSETDAHIFYRTANMNWPLSEADFQREQLEKYKQISAQLQTLTPEDLMVVTDNEPPEDVLAIWGRNSREPASIASNRIYNPASAVALEDGRILIPQTDMLWSRTPELAAMYATPPSDQYVGGWVTILKDVDGEWRVDETLNLCVGDCEDYWASFEQSAAPLSTPEASPVTETDWLAWITLEECVVEPMTTEEYGDIMREEPDISSRSYEVTGPADPESAMAVAAAAREHEACLTYGTSQQARALESPAYLFYRSASIDRTLTEHDKQTADIEHAMTISKAFAELDPEEYEVLSPEPPIISEEGADVDPSGVTSVYSGYVFNPEEAISLNDGRMAIPAISIYGSIGPDSIPLETMVNMSQQPPQLLIMTQASGTWKVDEVLSFCVGDCDAFWAERTSTSIVTPISSPVTTPET